MVIIWEDYKNYGYIGQLASTYAANFMGSNSVMEIVRKFLYKTATFIWTRISRSIIFNDRADKLTRIYNLTGKYVLYSGCFSKLQRKRSRRRKSIYAR